MVTIEKSARVLVLSGLALMAGCAGDVLTSAAALQPGIPAGARTFAVAPTDDAAKAAVATVEQRLRHFGFSPSATPDLLVEVSTAERSRGVGAYVPGSCGASGPEWVEPAESKWLVGGGKFVTLNVRMLDAATKTPLYQSSSSRRVEQGTAENQASLLAAAALGSDPRQASAKPAKAC